MNLIHHTPDVFGDQNGLFNLTVVAKVKLKKDVFAHPIFML